MKCKRCNSDMLKKRVSIRDLDGFDANGKHIKVTENSPYKDAIYGYFKCPTCGKESRKKLDG